MLHLPGDRLNDALDQLTASELIFALGSPPAAKYVFKHALVQDAAYESLLKSKRQQLHERIARTFEARFSDRIANAPELLAHHFTRAGLMEEAVPRWLEAGQRDLRRMALPEAVSHLSAALSVNQQLGASDKRDRQELKIRLALGTAYFALLGWVAIEVVQTLEPARALARRLGDNEKLVPILYYIWFHHGMRSDYGKALATAREIAEVARASGDSKALVTACMTEACTRCWVGEFQAARQLGEELLAIYDFDAHRALSDEYNHDAKCLTFVWAGLWLWALGWPDQAREACVEQLNHARRVGHAFNLLWGLSGGTMGLLLRGESESIREWLEEIKVVGKEQAMPIADLSYRWWDGYASVEGGDYEHAYSQAAPALKFWRDSGALHMVPYGNIYMARALGAMDRVNEAET